ncbi:hypothetical protein TBLA_0D01270 [Henningerozyma blattae CBS 6284]|uniref:Trimethylguanosine synthase n=1 Tax=Henningerozyma blattae (strain ATCC 34711 / CBS 6284 / DSM 70876 / NBRC 10599 / NRRL Y-10934 / UCD 77-7) TaxID=1071380 RepID=I2H2N3_HENB6|nr:hypothetical protein TBLA_0D01270 [Tetrapisispora blattae CBS 6284]CCH60635.1 hypothetical protein TBLA_0D01270 [Tetrapisispora blattae CBS 6284]
MGRSSSLKTARLSKKTKKLEKQKALKKKLKKISKTDGAEYSKQLKNFLNVNAKNHQNYYCKLIKYFKKDKYRVHPNQMKNTGITKENSNKLRKYWQNRYTLFTKMVDQPIYLTEELWYSVSPEKFAIFIAKFIKTCIPDGKNALDVFCGGGGNTIQLAKIFDKVYGIDNSIKHLYCTYKNSQTYNVENNTFLILGDWMKDKVREQFHYKRDQSKIKLDIIFASPPWGGPEYLKSSKYDLEKNLIPVGLTQLLQTLKECSDNIIIFLPKNSSLEQISQATRNVYGNESKCRVVYIKENGYMKGICAMWGDALINYYGETPEEKSAEQNQQVSYEIDG